MAETVRIEIPIETIDETEPELSNLMKKLGKVEESADKAGKSAKKASKDVTAFDKSADKAQRTLSKWVKEKYELLLEAKDKVSPTLSVLGSKIKSFSGKTWSVTMKAVDLVTSPVKGMINLLKNPVFQTGAALGVSIGFIDIINTYKDFEAAMSQVQAISGATGSELNKLTKKAEEMGGTTKFTAEESAEAFKYMAMAGWKTDDMLGGIEGILNLAAASGEDLATTSDIVTDALTAFGMKASEAGHFSDVLAQAASNANTDVSMMGESFKYVAPVAGAMKYKVEDVSLALGLMANSSVKGSMAGTALKTSLANMAAPTDKMTEAMDKYGISLVDSYGNMKTLKGVLDNLRSSLGGLSEAEQTAAASTIFGKEAMSGMLAIVNASKEEYDKLSEAVANADGTSKRMSEIQSDNLAGDITRFQSAVDKLKVSLGGRLSNSWLRDIVQWLTKQVPNMEQAFQDALDFIEMRLDRAKRKFKEISSTEEWKNADFLGKVKIAWDEFIAEPFSEWWNSIGKAKLAGFAQDIGAGIGTGLKVGIMTLFGIDLGETLDEGVSIGASFAKGFSKGIDFDVISGKLWTGFKNIISSAGKLLPGGKAADLSSVISAVILGKIITPFVSIGKGIGMGKWLFGTNAATGVSRMGALMGSTGNAMVSGSGPLGLLADAGYGLTGGSSMAGAMSGGTAALVGAGSVVGGLVGAAGLIHGGMDIYTGFTTDDEEKAKAYKKAGAIEIGGTLAGAGAGAAAGAAIGALFGGVGAAPGALIGAGIGAIGSWIAGNKVKEEYKENVEKMQMEAEKAQKIFEATGLAIEDVTFKNKALTQAMNDSGTSASQFALLFQEECAKAAKEAFGDISLSLSEVKKVASEITFAGIEEELNEFTKATKDADIALSNLEASVSNLKRENWKVGLGMELAEMDKDNYKSTIKSFLATSQKFIDDNHYQVVVALKLLSEGEVDTTGIDNYYNGLKNKIEDLGTKLTDTIDISLEDGVITLDEAAEIENIQNQILGITDKLTQAKIDAKMQTLQIKHNGAALNIDSFNAVQEEVWANVESASEQYENALTLTLSNLNLQFADGAITQAEYEEAVAKATEGYYVQINELDARGITFNLDSIVTAWNSKLSKIMPDIEEITTEKLTQALNYGILINPDVKTWDAAEVARWIGLDKLGLDPTDQAVIVSELIQTALAIPEGTKETIIQDFRSQIPTVEEIKSAIDWDSITNQDWSRMMETVTGSKEGLAFGFSAEDMKKTMAEFYGDSFENVKQLHSQTLHDALVNSTDNEMLVAFMEQYRSGNISGFDFNHAMQHGPASSECHEQIVAEWEEAGTAYGEALNNGVSTSLLSGASLFRENLQTALDATTTSPFTINPVVNVVPGYHVTMPEFTQVNQGVSSYAVGGFISGGPKLSWLAEEGYGEFIIPTNPSRRSRALELYKQAGEALGVGGYAAGGLVGGRNLSNKVSDYSSFKGIIGNPLLTYNEEAEGNENNTLIPVNIGQQKESSSVQIRVQMAPEFTIQSGNGQSEESIMQVIRRHMQEMADEIGGEIASKLEEVFSNMPLKEA